MGVLTIDIAAQENQPPNQSGYIRLSLANASSHTFSVANFTTETTPEYEDPEGDAFESVKITSLPTLGTLTLNGSLVLVGDVITSTQLNSSLFIYTAAVDDDGYSDGDMEFLVSDVGSHEFNSTPHTVSFRVDTAINQPPSQVGDGEHDMTLGEVFVFTRASLTSSLNPPYQDPEGNPAYKLLIDVVPSYGELQLNGVTVVDGQEILFTDIDSGLFSYVSESFPGSDLEGFQFRISDTVSQQYTG